MARTFYRIVRTSPPHETDFQSALALGKPAPRDEANRRLASGISVYATESQARRKVRTSPMLGSYIARLEVPEETVQIERTLTSAGHHTLWAEPEVLLACVTTVMRA
jgi:hypothetical protein